MSARVAVRCIKTSQGKFPIFVCGNRYYIIDKEDFVWAYNDDSFIGKWTKEYFYIHYGQYISFLSPEQIAIIEKFRTIKSRA